jgi:hypothetical protein
MFDSEFRREIWIRDVDGISTNNVIYLVTNVTQNAQVLFTYRW